MITVDHVTKRHGRIVSVDDVSLTIEAGQVTGLLGPNGAGKSSLMRIMCDLDRADAGSVHVAGRRYRDHPRPLSVVGAQFEGSGAHPGRTGRNHLRWVARTNGVSMARVDEMLEFVGLSPRDGKRRVKTYSLGMQQRLGIATALLADPQVVIFDEPANGLDPLGISWLRDALKGLARSGKTVLLSSHLMGETEMIADRVVLMDHGRVFADGKVQDFVAEHGSLEATFFARLDASRLVEGQVGR